MNFWDQDPVATVDAEWWNTDPVEGEEPSYLSQLGTALSTGLDQALTGSRAAFNAITSDEADLAANLAQLGRLQTETAANQTQADQRFGEALATADQKWGQGDYLDAITDIGGAVIDEPGAAFKTAVQSAPNAIIGLGGQLLGRGAGAAIGAAVGVPTTGPGAIATTAGGYVAGGVLANSVMEAGPAIFDVLNERTGGRAAQMTDEEIRAVLESDPTIMTDGLLKGASRGSVIGLIESLGLYGAGRVASTPARTAAAAGRSALVREGVEVASREALEAALADPAKAALAEAAEQAALSGFTRAGNVARVAAGTGIETAAAGAGEAAAQLVTEGQITPSEVAMEMGGELALGPAGTLLARGAETAASVLPTRATPAAPVDENVADLTATDLPVVQAATQAIDTAFEAAPIAPETAATVAAIAEEVAIQTLANAPTTETQIEQVEAPTPVAEEVAVPKPSWMAANTEEAGKRLAPKYGEQVSDFFAQRKTAKEVAKATSLTEEDVRNLRTYLNIPPWTNATNMGGAGVENPDFTAWLANRQKAAQPEPTNEEVTITQPEPPAVGETIPPQIEQTNEQPNQEAPRDSGATRSPVRSDNISLSPSGNQEPAAPAKSPVQAPILTPGAPVSFMQEGIRRTGQVVSIDRGVARVRGDDGKVVQTRTQNLTPIENETDRLTQDQVGGRSGVRPGPTDSVSQQSTFSSHLRSQPFTAKWSDSDIAAAQAYADTGVFDNLEGLSPVKRKRVVAEFQNFSPDARQQQEQAEAEERRRFAERNKARPDDAPTLEQVLESLPNDIASASTGRSRGVQPYADVAYMAAVEAGDMEGAQRMVDQAAREAGYDVGPVWHGSPNKSFTRFDSSQPNRRTNQPRGAFFFSTNKEFAEQFSGDGETRPFFVSSEGVESSGKRLPPISQESVVIDRARGRGAKGVKFDDDRDTIDTATGDVYVVFSPEQIKSADAVTRDDQGNVIPLSQRFQTDNPDIRYSQGQPAADTSFQGDPQQVLRERLGLTNFKNIIFGNYRPMANGSVLKGFVRQSSNKVYINLAAIENADDLVDVFLEEASHLIWTDPAVAAEWARLKELVPQDKLDALRAKFEKLGYTPEVWDEEAFNEIARENGLDELQKSALRRVWDAIVAAVRRTFGLTDDTEINLISGNLLRYAIRNQQDMTEAAAEQGERRSVNALRTSKNSPTDAEYLRAVEAGDMATAQRIVDEAAREAGYQEKVWQGVWGGEVKGNTYNPKYIGKRNASPLSQIGYMFSTSRVEAERHGKPKQFFLKHSNLNERGQKLDWWPAQEAVKQGADVLVWRNTTDASDDKSNIFLVAPGYESQIKSADPVVRDDDGRIIPPSERFQSDNADIRYSMRPPDDIARASLAAPTPDERTFADMMSARQQSENIPGTDAAKASEAEKENTRARFAPFEEEDRKYVPKEDAAVFAAVSDYLDSVPLDQALTAARTGSGLPAGMEPGSDNYSALVGSLIKRLTIVADEATDEFARERTLVMAREAAKLYTQEGTQTARALRIRGVANRMLVPIKAILAREKIMEEQMLRVQEKRFPGGDPAEKLRGVATQSGKESSETLATELDGDTAELTEDEDTALTTAEKRAQRLIYKVEERLRQGSKDLNTAKDGDSINRAFREQVTDPMEQQAFRDRLAKLNVGEAVADRLFTTAAREAADQEAMRVYREARNLRRKTDTLLAKDSPALVKLLNDLRRKMFPGMKWSDILSELPDQQRERQLAIYDRIRRHEALRGLTSDEALQLTNELDKAWQRERRKVILRELDRAGVLGEKSVVDRERVKAALPRLLRYLNLGVFNSEAFREAVAPEYGFKTMSPAEAQELRKMAQDAWKLPEGVIRNKALQKMLDRMQTITGVTRLELFENYWIASVLSGLRTQFDTWMATLNGFATVARLTLAAGTTNPKAVPAIMSEWMKGIGEGARESLRILFDGDFSVRKTYNDDMMKSLTGEKTMRPTPISERMLKEGNWWQKFPAAVMVFVSRSMAAADHVNNIATSRGAIAAAKALNPALYKGVLVPTQAERDAARQQAIREVTGGAEPTTREDRATVSVRTREILQGSTAEAAREGNEIGNMAAYQNDPTGVFGGIYNAINFAFGTIERAAGKVATDEDVDKFTRALAAVAAISARSVLGVRFARFGMNFASNSTSFVPGTYFARKILYGQELSRSRDSLIMVNNLLGIATMLALYSAFSALGDDEDDYGLEGRWDGLVPDKKRELMSAGKAPLTFWWRSKDGTINRIAYRQWEIGSVFAAVGSMLDKKKYRPSDWKKESVASHLLAATGAGMAHVRDLSALAALGEIFGKSAYAGDAGEEIGKKVNKIAANWVTAFLPNAFRDVDAWTDPQHYKAEDNLDAWLRGVPVVRRHVAGGRPMLTLLGDPVELDRSPWSRVYTNASQDEGYQVLGSLLARGIWMPTANTERKVRNKNGDAVPISSLGGEAEWKYQKSVGQRYREYLKENGTDLRAMSVEDAEEQLERDTARLREDAARELEDSL
jgi:hypothetical protein